MKFLIGLLSFTLSFESLAFAGIKEGGGGTRVEAAFRIRARELIEALAKRDAATALCPAAEMREALASEIRVVGEIVDPHGRCVPIKEVDACTYPGDIQLKQQPWEGFLSHTHNRTGARGTDALILHEIYRATKNCNDDKFVITEQVYPLVESVTAALSPPKFTWSSCYATQKKRDLKGNIITVESNHEDTYVHWSDGTTRYQLGSREFESSPGVKDGFVDQVMTVEETKNGQIDFYTVGKYFDVSQSGEVTTEVFERKYIATGSKSKFEVKDITHADPSKNLGKVVHTTNPGPSGHQTKIEEQLEPDPAGADGVQRISHKIICSIKTIEESEVDYSGVFRVEPKIKLFSKAHEKAMLTKDNWQTCQEKKTGEDCSLQKSAFERANKDRTALWTKLIDKSDLRKPRTGGATATTGHASSPGGNPMRCGTPAMARWIEYCEYRRPNCSELMPGGYCYGISGTVARCLGRRPNMRACGNFGVGMGL